MTFPDRRTANILLTILLFAVVLIIIYLARRILFIFFLAILFAYLLDPVVKLLQRHSLLFKNLRGPAVVEVYLVFIILLALSAHTLAPGLLKKADRMFYEVPVLLDDVSTGEIAREVGDKYGWSDAQESRLKAFLANHREDVQALVRNGERYTSKAPEVIALLVLVPLLAIFVLCDGPQIAKAIIHLASAGGKYGSVREIADEMHVTLTRYIRAKAILGGLSLLFYSAAMLLLNFPHAIALAIVGGFLEFIPVAGWMITAAGIIAVGVLTHSHWIWMAVLLGIWRLLQDYYNSPHIMGRQLEIHPLMTILAVMVGWEIGGIPGIYLLVPLIAALRVIWRRSASRDPQLEYTQELIRVAK